MSAPSSSTICLEIVAHHAPIHELGVLSRRYNRICRLNSAPVCLVLGNQLGFIVLDWTQRQNPFVARFKICIGWVIIGCNVERVLSDDRQ